MSRGYIVLWDNGHASGKLTHTHTRKADAEAYGRAWKAEMVSIERTPGARAEAREMYQWEVKEVELCERCGGDKPTGQSCGCFDNGCQ